MGASVLAFTTKTFKLADRVSAVVTLQAVSFNRATRIINAFSSDGRVRQCKVDRMESLIAARLLWVQLKGSVGCEVRFIAAGGFNPNSWFYHYELV
jgi:hypothetical protein